MSNHDDGQMAILAQWMVDVLTALQHEEKTVFTTADLYRHQIEASRGALDKIASLAPLAFVCYKDDDTAREGGRDLREVFEFPVIIGQAAKEDGVAKWGNDNTLGLSKLRDLVIAAFDKKRPDDPAITCDEFYYTGSILIIDTAKVSALQMHFETSKMTPN